MDYVENMLIDQVRGDCSSPVKRYVDSSEKRDHAKHLEKSQ